MNSAADLVRSCLKVWNWRLYFFILLFLGLPNDMVVLERPEGHFREGSATATG